MKKKSRLMYSFTQDAKYHKERDPRCAQREMTAGQRNPKYAWEHAPP